MPRAVARVIQRDKETSKFPGGPQTIWVRAFSEGGSNAQSAYLIDNVRIRPVVDPEPLVSIGSEDPSPCKHLCSHGSYIDMVVLVRELKNRLSEYLRRVRAGERVVVALRGRPVAELRPIRHERLTPAERLRRMEEAGEVTRGSGRALREIKPSRVRGRPVAETLLEERGPR
jgi:prevent-host-death family protein